jgi:signal transduction histidine kinase
MRVFPHRCVALRSGCGGSGVAPVDRIKPSWLSPQLWTLVKVTSLSFAATGAVLLVWDGFEHARFGDVSAEVWHRLHIIRGISTSVLVSVGVAWVLLRSGKRHEEERLHLQRELIRKERLAAIGELAGGVAHEIRNPIAGIGGALAMLAREIPQDDDSQEIMREIQQQLQRMDRLVGDLLSYARPGRVHPEWIHPHTILTQAASRVRQIDSLPESDLILDLDPGAEEVFADARELEHAFENLILNAFQAVATGGKVEVRTKQQKHRLRLLVIDNGCGIETANRERIFEPFFTTKARGTGLGLSLVRRAVEHNGGKVVVHSAEGRGSTFEMEFPTNGEAAPAGPNGAARAA